LHTAAAAYQPHIQMAHKLVGHKCGDIVPFQNILEEQRFHRREEVGDGNPVMGGVGHG
jgi:hypothetical protein